MSHVTDKRSSLLWFPVAFAVVQNLTSFRPFLLRDCLLFLLSLACCMGSYAEKV